MMKNRIGHRTKYASAGGLEILVEGDHTTELRVKVTRRGAALKPSNILVPFQ